MEKRIFTHVEWWRGAGTKEISPHLTTHIPWDGLEHENFWARTFKCLWGPGIDSKEWIPPAYVAWRPV